MVDDWPESVTDRPPNAPRLRVLLVGNYLPDGQESMQRFAQAMLAGIRSRGVKVQLVRPAEVFGRLAKSSHSGLGKWLGYFDKLVLFPGRLKREVDAAQRAAASEDATLVVHICDHSNAFYARHLRQVAHVVTCHDLLAVRSARGEIAQNRTRWSGRRLQEIILDGLNRSPHVVCVSDATERDLRRLSTLRGDQISVIPNSLNYAYASLPVAEARARVAGCFRESRRGGPGENYVLHVGGNQWYKNRPGVLRSYARLLDAGEPAPSLVLVGEPLNTEMESFVRDARLEDKIFRVQSCSSEELRALYSAAGVLLFPSLAEGFGWPVIEAQACGCPVVCSSVNPFPEVAGPGACMRELHDEQGLADAIRRLMTDPAFRSEMIAAGIANAERFQPETMISKYLECYAGFARSATGAPDLHVCAPSSVAV